MPLGGSGTTVVLVEGVVMGTGRSTAVGVVSKLVDVEASLGVSVEVLDLISDYHVSNWMSLAGESNDVPHPRRKRERLPSPG